jgi:hypothetical protein
MGRRSRHKRGLAVLTFAVVTAAGSAALTLAALDAPHRVQGTEDSMARGCTAPSDLSRAPHRPFIVSDAQIYRDSCTLARLLGPKRMAHEYLVRSTNRLTICQRFVKVGYRPVLFRLAIDGCLKGFRLRDRK